MATSSKTTGVSASTVGGRKATSTREGSAKATVAEQLSQAVLSTSNLLSLMQQSSPAHSHLVKLPKNLLAKASTIKNTEQVLEQMPRAISSLDAYIDSGLQSVSHLKTVIQLLANIESSQFKCLSSQPQQLPPQEEAPKEEEEELPSEVSTVVE